MKLPFGSAGLVLVWLASSAHAQHALVADYKGNARLVRRVVETEPYVDDGTGKLVPATSFKYALTDAREFTPVFVSIRNLHADSSYVEEMGSGSQLNHEFHFKADFESPFGLKNVFVVLDLKTEEAGKALFIHEVGDLGPRQLKSVRSTVRMGYGIGEGRFQVHVFSDGVEVFNSLMPFDYVEAKLDEIVRKQIQGETDAGPRPFVGPAPEYPAKLWNAKVAGKAMVKFTVGRTGRVLNPEVVSATDPAFADSALAAARQWRFLPRIKNGVPVETPVQMPFVFGSNTWNSNSSASK